MIKKFFAVTQRIMRQLLFHLPGQLQGICSFCPPDRELLVCLGSTAIVVILTSKIGGFVSVKSLSAKSPAFLRNLEPTFFIFSFTVRVQKRLKIHSGRNSPSLNTRLIDYGAREWLKHKNKKRGNAAVWRTLRIKTFPCLATLS